MSAKPKPGSPFENDPMAQAILREGLLIQDRFSAEPVYARTGKGYLNSVGVSEIQELKRLDLEFTQEQIARSLAGHIVAGVASDEEVLAFRKFCESLG